MERSFPTGIVSVKLRKLSLLKVALGLTPIGDFIIEDGDQKMSFEKITDVVLVTGPIIVIGKSSDGRSVRIEIGDIDGQATVNILDPDPETPDE